jgi:molybdopterin synthase catalytic subunit/molybdopterin converting factor small subunit
MGHNPRFAPELSSCHTRPMRVRVLLFGPLAEIYGTREEWLDLPGSASAADVHQHYRERDTRIGELGKSLHIAVNQVIAAPNHPLAAEDEVALLPPVCGGTENVETDLIDLVEVPLEDYPWRRHFTEIGVDFGAVVSFEGLVRKDLSGDKREADFVTALAFDAYRPMANASLRDLAVEARRHWPIQSLVLLHRVGTVHAGEICVVTAVAAGHREEAFAACKFLIDTLKTTVPLWKKEITASTSHWVEGVLLPDGNKSGSI